MLGIIGFVICIRVMEGRCCKLTIEGRMPGEKTVIQDPSQLKTLILELLLPATSKRSGSNPPDHATTLLTYTT